MCTYLICVHSLLVSKFGYICNWFEQFDTPITSEITPKDGVHYKMSHDFVKLWADFAADK